MLFLDLFSGIGGFSLGFERAGMTTIAFCEFAEYPRSILKKHWPDIPIANDVKKLSYNFKTKQLFYKYKVIYVGTIQLICGGFPCQPFSVAGKQAGKEDDRHLWPEMFRLIKEVKPRWAVGENVAGFISMALDDVLFDLESESYETQSFVIPACAVGGIHRRDRVWICAHSQHNGAFTTKKPGGKGQAVLNNQEGSDQTSKPQRVCSSSDVANTESVGSVKSPTPKQTKRQRNESRKENFSNVMANSNNERLQGEQVAESNESVRTRSNDQQFTGCDGSQSFRSIEPPTQPPVRHRNDGLSDNVARLKALGNAVVPQIPEIIGRAIMAIEAQ